MLYHYIIRPVLFLFRPEFIHDLIVFKIRMIRYIPGVRKLFRLLFDVSDRSLERNVFGLKFKNPVGLAAGFDKNARIYNEFAGFGFSFIEIGTVTPLSQPGNPKPRSFRLKGDQALINRMGINNDGAGKISDRIRRKPRNVIIGGNIGKNTLTPNSKAIDDYMACFEVLYEVVDYFVVNVSCPNIGDIKELQDAGILAEILSMLKERSRQKPVHKPVLLKISPDLNLHQLDEIVEIALKTGIDGFVATNTTVTRDNLRTPVNIVEKIGQGGLSGKPLRDRSTEVIRYLVRKSGGNIPVIGVGGIMNPEDALEKLNAGASLIQIYTGFVYEGPFLVKRINKALIRR